MERIKKTIMIAHKGYSGKYPENTALAFKMAGEHGSGGAETDVRMTKDGVYVTHHNDDIHFADGTECLISEHTFDELRQKPLRNDITDDLFYRTERTLYDGTGARRFHARPGGIRPKEMYFAVLRFQ